MTQVDQNKTKPAAYPGPITIQTHPQLGRGTEGKHHRGTNDKHAYQKTFIFIDCYWLVYGGGAELAGMINRQEVPDDPLNLGVF